MSSLPISQTGAGTLRASIRLADRNRVHYGSNDPIVGRVILMYQPNTNLNAQLFGPLKVDVWLNGKHKAIYNDPPSTAECRGHSLCSTRHTIHSGPFRADPSTEFAIAFSIPFPVQAEPINTYGYRAEPRPGMPGTYNFESTITSSTIEPLPPSLIAAPQHGNHDLELYGSTVAYKQHKTISVVYTLGLEVSLPGLSSITVGIPAHEQEVLYDAPRISPSIAAERSATSSTQAILNVVDEFSQPEDSKPSGFRSKAKSLLSTSSSSRPQVPMTFEYLHVPRYIYTTQPLSFTLGVQPSLTVPAASVSLVSVTVHLLAHTFGVDPVPSSEKKISHRKTVKCKTCDFSPPGPFDKATEYRKDVDVGTLTHVPTSFRYGSVGREYTLRIEVKLQVGSQSVVTRRDFKVEVCPELELDGDEIGSSETVVAGPSTQALTSDFATLSMVEEGGAAGEEFPPAYDDAIASGRQAQEAVPDYHAATTTAAAITPGTHLHSEGTLRFHPRPRAISAASGRDGEWVYASEQTGWRPERAPDRSGGGGGGRSRVGRSSGTTAALGGAVAAAAGGGA